MGENWDRKSLMRTQKGVHNKMKTVAAPRQRSNQKQVNVFISPHSKILDISSFRALPPAQWTHTITTKPYNFITWAVNFCKRKPIFTAPLFKTYLIHHFVQSISCDFNNMMLTSIASVFCYLTCPRFYLCNSMVLVFVCTKDLFACTRFVCRLV